MDERTTPTTADIAGSSTRADDLPAADEPLASDPGELDEPQEEEATEPSEHEPRTGDSSHEQLLPADQEQRFTVRWREIQAGFVDEPRQSVEQADALVADLMQRLAAGFSAERERLESQWDSGDDVSTEDLRVALTRYRSFFERLLSA
jgi:hypothetical protein